MRVKRYDELFENELMTEYFIDNLDKLIIESNTEDNKNILNKIAKEYKLNFELISTFGFGITAFYPIIDNLIKNMSLNIDLDLNKIVLITVSSFTIIYLEENKKKIKDSEEASIIKSSKSMLEELRMSGIGNGIIKKIINCIKSIKNIFSLILKYKGVIIKSIYDMFTYSALLLPILNGVAALTNKYDLNIDTLPGNFLSLGVGLTGIIAKHGVIYILDKIKDKLSSKERKQIIDDISHEEDSYEFAETSNNINKELIQERD